MPLAAPGDHPALSVLRAEGVSLASGSEGLPVLRVGLLNLMPDSVVSVTECQWMRLFAGVNDAVTSICPFTVGLHRKTPAGAEHVRRFHEPVDQVRDKGLDLLIVTGAVPATSDITDETYWSAMIETIQWARDLSCPVICSCLATHAVAKAFFGIDRVRLPSKRWGVFEHELLDADHAVVQTIDSGWIGPHSHEYEVTREQLERAGIRVLVSDDEAGVYLAVTPDEPKFIFLQGHPEYDAIGLLKEFKREVTRFTEGETSRFPRLPDNYFDAAATTRIQAYRQELERVSRGTSTATLAGFPELEVSLNLTAPWRATGTRLIENLVTEIANGR